MRAKLNGYIVFDVDAEFYRWMGYDYVACPGDIRQAIVDNPQGETLEIEINSPGGSMFAGYEMYSALKAAACATRSEVQSLSASAASIAMLGTDEVFVSPVAQVMIHGASLSTQGGVPDHYRSINAMNSFKESILNAYELKSNGKKSRAELSAMLDAETWLSPQEAIAAGLVDGVLYDEGGVIASQVVNCVGAGIRSLAARGGLPEITDELRAQYAAEQKKIPPDEAKKSETRRLQAVLDLYKLF